MNLQVGEIAEQSWEVYVLPSTKYFGFSYMMRQCSPDKLLATISVLKVPLVQSSRKNFCYLQTFFTETRMIDSRKNKQKYMFDDH